MTQHKQSHRIKSRSTHNITSHCIMWHDATQAITSHQITLHTSHHIALHHVTWHNTSNHIASNHAPRIKSHRIASCDMTQHKQSHRIKSRSTHHITSRCITWHDTTQKQSHRITTNHSSKPHVTSQPTTLLHVTPQATSWHQNRSHHHHGTAEGSFTAKKWFGHRAGRSPCAHSIGKFFLCYIVLFFFWNFRPRLARELLVWLVGFRNLCIECNIIGIQCMTEKRHASPPISIFVRSSHGMVELLNHWDISRETGSQTDGWVIHAAVARCVFDLKTH